MDYNRVDPLTTDTIQTANILVAGTLGRGAWLLSNVTNVLNSAPRPNGGTVYTVNEGSSVVLSASGSSDPNGLALTYTWDLDGDGKFGETGNDAKQGNEVGINPTFSAAELNGFEGSQKVVKLRVTNSAGSSSVDKNIRINIKNVAPTISGLALSSTVINENDTITLTGSFNDPGIPDKHKITINWGDGTTSVLFKDERQLTRTFQLSHQYLDDPPSGTSSDLLPITVTVDDFDGGIAQASTTIRVNNIAPAVTSLALSAYSINENDTITLSGTFTDPGTLDTHTVIINWGDGTTSTLPVNQLNQANRAFQLSHQYLDDTPTGTPSDLLPITVTVLDDDHGSAQASTAIRVNNVNPVITSFTSNANFADRARINKPITVNATFTDIGTLDTHRAFVDWGDGTPSQEVTVFQGNGSGAVQGSHVYLKGGAYSVRLLLNDDDTGADSRLLTAIIIGTGGGPG